MIVEEIRERVRADGLLASEQAVRGVVVMLSGGRDSTCLLDVAVALCGPQLVSALHVNYGLRARADEEQEHCAALCRALSAELETVRAPRPAPGNLQAWAREFRYEAGARVARARGDALIATGHTASDQVETILYRLAASPGRRALLGMVVAEGRLVRPLLWATREQTAAYCRARGLEWSEDESNSDRRFARARVRHELIPALRAVHPAAEASVLRTAALLREESELLERLVDDELGGVMRVSIGRLAELPAALARLLVIRLAERTAGTYVPQAGERVGEIVALDRTGARAELHIGGSVAAVVQDGVLEMVRLPPREVRPPNESEE